MDNKNKRLKTSKVVILILVLLLVFVSAALVIRVVHLNNNSDQPITAVVGDNLIGDKNDAVSSQTSSEVTSSVSEKPSQNSKPVQNVANDTSTLSLFAGKPSDNTPFQVSNMLPGDSEEKYFSLKVNHSKGVRVYFEAEVTEQTKSLGDILHITITNTDNGTVVYDGEFNKINDTEHSEFLPTVQSNESNLYYKIEVSMPTAAGNEYQAALLRADLRWYVVDEGALSSPVTGDTGIIVLIAILVLLLSGAVLLAFTVKRKERQGKCE